MLTDADFPRFVFSSTQVNIGECGVWIYAGTTSPGSWTMPVRQPSYTAGQIRRADASVYWVACLSTAAPLTLNRASSDNFLYAGATATSVTINPGESVMIVNDGGFWLVLSGAIPPAIYKRVLPTSAGTRTLAREYPVYVFTGVGATVWTLPAIANNTGLEFLGKNRGSANITLQRAGSDQLYDTAAVNSITIAPGGSFRVINDGTYWVVM